MVADVRSDGEYRAISIRGSLPVPTATLRTRAYWRERPVLLVDRGYRGTELERTCRELREAGFARAAILEGGIDEWPPGREPLRGTPKGLSSLRRIPPRDLLRQSRFEHWAVVLARSTHASDDDEIDPPHAVTIDAGRGETAFAADLLRELRSRRSADRPTYVALVLERAADRPMIERALAQYQIPHLYWLDGDLASYRAAFEQERRIARAAVAPLPGTTCAAARARR